METNECLPSCLGIIGLGYVGLPLAVAFAQHFAVKGFDISQQRIAQLKQGFDASLEVEPEALQAATRLSYHDCIDDLHDCDVYIITVPTPVDQGNNPDLSPLIGASRLVGPLLSRGNVVIYESTVYPGTTEEICVPELERSSGLVHNRDFYTGYSPERINPGDKRHRLETITKITSGSTPESAEWVDCLYRYIITAGTHRAPSIRVAEAAKVIENIQRDVNIALINELAIIFNRLGIDTQAVLDAAGTKWNFLPFKPGLVGGHCIGVDPYYLSHKAQATGYYPEMILLARRINNGMGEYVAARVIKLMIRHRKVIAEANILILGLTFKENCPDLRNTRVVDVIAELESYGAHVDVHDPWADPQQAREEYGIRLITPEPRRQYDAIVLAVAHRQFIEMGVGGIRALCKADGVVYDIKSVLPDECVDGRL